MSASSALSAFARREWLLILSGAAVVLTSIAAKTLPAYSPREGEVLLVLAALFVTVQGLQNSGLVTRVAQRIERGRAVPLKLVIGTFVLSMVATNDVALMAIVPLTLSLEIEHKDVLVILEALAANSGSALTPMGNPQNLYIYWLYGIDPVLFIHTMMPFALAFLVLLSIASLWMGRGRRDDRFPAPGGPAQGVDGQAYLHGVLFVLIVLTTLHVLPIICAAIILPIVLIFDRRSLRVDYSFLLTLVALFGVSSNVKSLIPSQLQCGTHVFLISALSSQIVSNVPAALMLARFTPHWSALLWGVNAGGFGSLIGSLANLIAYRFYVSHTSTNRTAAFTAKFLVFGYVAFLVAAGLYLACSGRCEHGF